MANILKPKRSGVASSVPTTANLADGEVAINYADGKIYLRAGATVYEVANAAVASTIAWGNITGKPTTLAGYGITDAAPLTGAEFSGDILTYRTAAPDTGVIYLGTGYDRYVYYDGTNYNMPGARLFVDGVQVWSPHNFDPTTKVTKLANYTYSNANDHTEFGGVTFLSTATNTPTNDWATILSSGGTTRAFQIGNAWNTTSPSAFFIRRNTDGTWSPWYTLWNSGNFDPATKSDVGHTQAFSTITGTIADAQLPDRIRTSAFMVSDWNNALDTGWYMYPGGLNAPAPTAWFMGRVTKHDSNWVTQEVWDFTSGVAGVSSPIYRRQKSAGTWSSWSTNIYTNNHMQAGSRFYVSEGSDTATPVGAGRVFGAYYLPGIYDGSVLLSYDYTAAIYKPMKIEASSLSVNPGAVERFSVINGIDSVVVNGRAILNHAEATAGLWYNDSTNTKNFFVGMMADNVWGLYSSLTADWTTTFDHEGRMSIRNANSTTKTRQPRVFVQSADPGAAAADGDLWFW